jgi:predicted RNase H-like HicB family nuclease
MSLGTIWISIMTMPRWTTRVGQYNTAGAAEVGQVPIHPAARRAIRSAPIAVEETEMRQVVIYPGEDGYWVAECPSLPGCVSQGKTREEAVANAREAIREYVIALEEDNLPVPADPFETMVIAV